MVNQKLITRDNLYDSIKKAQAYGNHDSWYCVIFPHLKKMRHTSDHERYLSMIEHFVQKEEYINELIEVLQIHGEL